MLGLEKGVARDLALHALDDKNGLVRLEAAEYLSQNVPTEDVMRRLVPFLRHEDPLLRRAIAEVFGNAKKKAHIKLLRRRLNEERSLQARIGLLYGLYVLGEKCRVTEMLKLLSASSYKVRCAAANYLGDMCKKTNNEVVVDALEKQLLVETTVAAKSSIAAAVKAVRNGRAATAVRLTLRRSSCAV